MFMVIYALYTERPRSVESDICQNRADTRISCTRSQTVPRVRLSFKESRMEFLEANQLHRKYGLWGTRQSLRTRP